LALGAACGALLLAGGVATHRISMVPAGLTGAERAVIEAVAVTIFPGDPGPPGDKVGVADFVEDFLRQGIDPVSARLLRSAFRAIEFGAVLGAGSRFSRLSAPRREALLLAFERHPSAALRSAMAAMKFLVSLAYFEHPAVREACGIGHHCSWSA
jgi:hypothetical protein